MAGGGGHKDCLDGRLTMRGRPRAAPTETVLTNQAQAAGRHKILHTHQSHEVSESLDSILFMKPSKTVKEQFRFPRKYVFVSNVPCSR